MTMKKLLILAGVGAVAFVAWRSYTAAKVTGVTQDNAPAIVAAWRSGGVSAVRAYLASTGQGPINAGQAQTLWDLSASDVGYLKNQGVLA